MKVYPPFTSPVDSKNKNFCEGRLTNKIETVGWRSHFCDGILAKNVKVGRPSPFSPALHMCDGRPTFCPLSPLLHRCDGRLTKKCDDRLTMFSLYFTLWSMLEGCDGRPTFCPLSPVLHRCDGGPTLLSSLSPVSILSVQYCAKCAVPRSTERSKCAVTFFGQISFKT